MTKATRPSFTVTLVTADDHRRIDVLDAVREAVLLSAAHLDLFQSKVAHEKLRAVLGNISDSHLDRIRTVGANPQEEREQP